MMKRFLSYGLLFAVVLGVAYCGGGESQEPDTSQYNEICEQMRQCDSQVAEFPDAMQACTKGLAGLAEEEPAKAEEAVECMRTSECTTGTMMKCLLASTQDMLPNQ